MTSCVFCDEELDGTDSSPDLIGTAEGPRGAHRQCMIRSARGGIGHLVAHEYWCGQHNDPDAGLTFRQSALLVATWIDVVGINPVTPISED
jgi:hypothetical protein